MLQIYVHLFPAFRLFKVDKYAPYSDPELIDIVGFEAMKKPLSSPDLT